MREEPTGTYVSDRATFNRLRLLVKQLKPKTTDVRRAEIIRELLAAFSLPPMDFGTAQDFIERYMERSLNMVVIAENGITVGLRTTYLKHPCVVEKITPTGRVNISYVVGDKKLKASVNPGTVAGVA